MQLIPHKLIDMFETGGANLSHSIHLLAKRLVLIDSIVGASNEVLYHVTYWIDGSADILYHVTYWIDGSADILYHVADIFGNNNPVE